MYRTAHRSLIITVSMALLGFVAHGASPLPYVSDAQAAEEQNKNETPDPATSRQHRIDNLTMHIVYDNNPGNKGLTADWGFGCFIRGPEKTILFDTGTRGELLLANMRKMNLDPADIDVIVLSHRHLDHIGGLPAVAAGRKHLPVYVPAGMPSEFTDLAQRLELDVIVADEPRSVCPGVTTTGTLGKGRIEEHGLCLNTAEGWMLITGCAHPGVENLAAQARKVTGRPLHFVIGGFHLVQQRDAHIRTVIKRLEELGVKRAAPCHCSGDRARELFKAHYKDHCDLVVVGDTIHIEPPPAENPS